MNLINRVSALRFYVVPLRNNNFLLCKWAIPFNKHTPPVEDQFMD